MVLGKEPSPEHRGRHPTSKLYAGFQFIFFTLSDLSFISFSCFKNSCSQNWLKIKELLSCSQQHILLATIYDSITIYTLRNMKKCLFKNRTKHQLWHAQFIFTLFQKTNKQTKPKIFFSIVRIARRYLLKRMSKGVVWQFSSSIVCCTKSMQ